MSESEDAAIVEYNNKLNLLSFKQFSQLENCLFFSIMSRMKNKGKQEVNLSFSEITQHIGKNLNSEQIAKELDKTSNKLMQTFVRFETKDCIDKFTIFEIFRILKEERIIRVKITDSFLFLLNNIEKNFTLFELAEFSTLSGKYSQTLYRLLKQFRNTGLLIMEWEEFKTILNIPKSYKVCDIDKQILKPSIKEFAEKDIFRNLKYTKVRGRGRGRPVVRIDFDFTPETEEIIKINNTNKEDLVFMLQREGVNKKTAKEYADKAERTDKIKIILKKFDKMVKRAEKHTSKQKYLLGAMRNEIDGIQQREITDIPLPPQMPPKTKREEKEEEFVYGEIPNSTKEILEGFGLRGLLKDEE